MDFCDCAKAFNLLVLVIVLSLLPSSLSLRLSSSNPSSLLPDEVPGVGSLPPPTHPGDGDEPHIEMLPSHRNIVTHDGLSAEERPERRPLCEKVIDDIETSASERKKSSGVFEAFKAINSILVKTAKEQTKPDYAYNSHAEAENDKLVVAALTKLRNAQAQPMSQLDWQFIKSLKNCAIDEYGRTIFMSLVRDGYLQAISLPVARTLSALPFSNLKDTLANNIVHLAVYSKTNRILTFVLSLLNSSDKRRLLEEANLDSLRPIDISNAMTMEDMHTTLKTEYKVLSVNTEAEAAKLENRGLADTEAAAEAESEVTPSVAAAA